MRRFIKVFLPFLFLFFFLPQAQAMDNINLYFFYGDGCPHCHEEARFLDKLEKEASNIKIHRYEVWNNRNNAKFLTKLAKDLDLDISGVPVLIVGDKTIVGYYNDKITGEQIKALIDEYANYGCEDIVAPFLGWNDSQCVHGCDAGDEECLHNCGCEADNVLATKETPDTLNIPLIGSVSIKNFSLPTLTFLIAAVDGFNPCAMWVLLFLISLLLGMENKKRMWILGSGFIITSGAVYFLFLSAWLNLFLFLGFVLWIRLAIGAVALFSGGYHLREAYKHREGCPVAEKEKRQRVFRRIRKIISEQKFYLALSGIILLAVAVNLVELVCSAGLPAVYTGVLAFADLSPWQHYSYLLFYIFIFMLDDLLIFFIAMTTLKMKAVGGRFSKWSGWIGGTIMVIIGLLLLFKPGWLMFG